MWAGSKFEEAWYSFGGTRLFFLGGGRGGAYVPGGMKRKGFIRTGLWAFTVIPFPGIDI